MELRDCPSFPGWTVSERGTKAEYNGKKTYRLWKPTKNGRAYLYWARPGSLRPAHRLVHDAWVSPVPRGVMVLHYDDNTHNNHASNLRLGDALQNREDAVRNGGVFSPDGSCVQCKLSNAQVDELRRLFSTGEYTQTEVADKFGISQSHVGDIVRGECRGPNLYPIPETTTIVDQQEDIYRRYMSGENPKSIAAAFGCTVHYVCALAKELAERDGVTLPTRRVSKLSDEQVKEALRLHKEDGVSLREIGRRLGVRHTSIRDIVRGKRRVA